MGGKYVVDAERAQSQGWDYWGRRNSRGTYLATWGAIALQGPHQTAKASTMTMGFLAMASLNSPVLLCNTSYCQSLGTLVDGDAPAQAAAAQATAASIAPR